ncbi:hypothetical protein C0995_008365 [Termitomyces sp. Mi166|nr:hypothetical protein C0995_008365 [Termitomyces sp. Mi166\
MAMILDPREKMSYFKKHWPKDLHVKVLKCVEEVFQEQFLRFNDSEDPKKMEVPKLSAKGLHELSDDENEDDTSDMVSSMKNHGSHHTEDPNQPWSRYFDEYLKTQENVLEGWSQIEWWGFNSRQFHPAWESLACNYLSIMASSVSSERAFSQGGLTITKQRNRLKGDIVEALQCLKCAIQHDLLFREPGPSSLYEAELEKLKNGENDGAIGAGEEGWDELLSDDEDEDSFDMDIDLDSD